VTKFKTALHQLKQAFGTNLTKPLIDNLTIYLDKSQNGTIKVSDLILILGKDFSAYDPLTRSTDLLDSANQHQRTFAQIKPQDIIIPLATALKNKNIQVDQLFQKFDKDKSYLLSIHELALVVK